MGLFSWLFGSDERSSITKMQVADITNGPGTYNVDVVGESHYQKALERICGGRTENSQRLVVEAFLVLEDDNPRDSKAVRISIQGKTVGYLDRETARSFRKQIAGIRMTGVAAKCSAIIVGGWDRGGGDRGHFGVKLDLPTA
jgi:hypothetical protein